MDEFPEDFDAGTIITNISEKDAFLKILRKSIYANIKEHGYYDKTFGHKSDPIEVMQKLAIIGYQLKTRGFYVDISFIDYEVNKEKFFFN